MADFDINQLYRLVWPYVQPPPYRISRDQTMSHADRFDTIPGPVPPSGRQGLYGVVLQMPCRIDDVDLPNEPLIDIAGTKQIVETAIDGNDGTFKELYSLGDYQITIRGIAINEDDPDNYPEDQVRQLRRLAETKKHVPITNALTTLFNVTHIAIKDYSFPAVPGQIGAQPYEFRCSSDREFQLRLRER